MIYFLSSFMKKSVKYISLIVIGILLGIIANRNREYLINAQFIRDHWHFRKALEDKTKIAGSENVMVCLTLGQSNAANYGNGTYNCRNEVYNYYNGDLYKAKEPLLGADGSGSSVWTRVADILIDSGLFKKVIIVPCAIGSTSVNCWAEGHCSEKLKKILGYLTKDNIKITHIFWDQGETDNVDKTSKDEYKIRLKMVIKTFRDRNFNAPFFCTITGYFPYANTNQYGIDRDITTAQNEVISEIENVKRGPNTDSLNLAYYRSDGVHFTENGLDKLAQEWYKKIKASYVNP
jgi:hypothetical protein